MSTIGEGGGDVARPAQGVAVHRVAGRIGAVVDGVRLGPDLAPEVVAAVRQAANQHKVVFLRAQHHLDDEAHVGFGRLLGEVVGVPGMAPADVAELDSRQGVRANVWHTDVTFSATPFAYSILRAEVVPPWGGDTSWANTAAAYAELPPPLQELAEQLWARHTNDYDYAAAFADQDPEVVAAMTRAFRANRLEAEHPVVRVHPETGERTLLLGAFARKVVGVSDRASEHLLAMFAEHVTRPEHTVRWTWQAGDVAIWDNRATQHYALNDYDDQPRLMRRVTVAGDLPTSVDGRTSTQVEG